MERLDILAVKSGLLIRQMMELAGFHIVEVFKRLKIQKSAKIVIVVGKGNKGGDGLSAARHLVNNGWRKVSVVMLSGVVSKDSAHHWKLLKKMKVPIIIYGGNKKKAQSMMLSANVIIDALIGYHLQGAPRGIFKEVIEFVNKAKKKVIAYDIPSGIEAATGKCHEPCIKARATLTLALPKRAFKKKEAKTMSGKIFLGDIGIPGFLYDKIKLNSRPAFDQSPSSLITL